VIPLERQRTLLRLLEERGTISINELVSELDVSHMTVRRDIHRLEELGRVVSVTGGVSLPVRLALDQAHDVKTGLQRAPKAAIARAAVKEAAPGALVFLDAGTTGLAIGHLLAERSDLTFVTNDLAIASHLSDRGASQLYFAGGRIDRANRSSEGLAAAEAVAAFNIDVAFMSTASFDLRGTSVTSEEKRAVKRAIKDSALRTVLVTDSTKYGKVAPLRALPLTDFDEIVTDSGLPASAIDGITRMDVPLTLVEPS